MPTSKQRSSKKAKNVMTDMSDSSVSEHYENEDSKSNASENAVARLSSKLSRSRLAESSTAQGKGRSSSVDSASKKKIRADSNDSKPPWSRDKNVLDHFFPNGADSIVGKLTRSCYSGDDILRVKRLIKLKGASSHNNSISALCAASAQGHWDVVEILLEAGADIEGSGRPGIPTPLQVACYAKRYDVLELLLEASADIEVRSHGDTPLLHAARFGHTKTAAVLLDHHADIEARDIFGRTPLMVAARQTKPEVLQLLIKEGADIEATDNDSRNALQRAVARDYPEIVDILLSHGADVDARDSSWRTSVMSATKTHNLKMLDRLKSAGADFNAIDIDGKTALSRAMGDGELSIIKFLLQAGADPDALQDGEPPLQWAVSNKKVSIARALLEHGANPSIGNGESGHTLLEEAYMSGDIEIFRLLLKHGAQWEDERMRSLLISDDKKPSTAVKELQRLLAEESARRKVQGTRGRR